MASSFGVRAGNAFVEVRLRDRLDAGIRASERKLRAFASNMQRIGQTALLAGIAASTVFGFSLKTFAGFTDQMAELKAITGATFDEFERLSAQAKLLGRTTSFTAIEVGSGQTELGRAGFGPDEIMASTSAVLALSRATRTDLAEAATIAGKTLRGFRLQASQMPDVVDVLAATANNSAQNVTSLFEALKTVGPVAVAAGDSLEKTAAAIGVLANNGIEGTLAGTAMRRAYLNLANPKILKAVKRLTDVDATDAAGNLRPLSTVITEIGRAVRDLPSAERIDIFAQIFGDRGLVAASNLATSKASFDDLLSTIENSTGVAQRAATTMDDTLGGSFRMLQSAVEGVQIAIGGAIGPAVRDLTDWLTDAAGAVTVFVNENRELVLAAGLAAGGLVAGGAALLTVAATTRLASFGIGTVAKSAIGLARPVAGAVSSLSGLLSLAGRFAGVRLIVRSLSGLSGGLRGTLRVLSPATGAFRVFGGVLDGAVVASAGAAGIAIRALMVPIFATATVMGRMDILANRFGRGILFAGRATRQAGGLILAGSRSLSVAGRGLALVTGAGVVKRLGGLTTAFGRVALRGRMAARVLRGMTVMGMLRGLSLGLSVGLGKVARGLFRIGTIGDVAGKSLAAAAGSLRLFSRAGAGIGAAVRLVPLALAAAVSPATLLAAAAAGVVAALVHASGGTDALAGGFAALVDISRNSFGRILAKASSAWGEIRTIGTSAFGAIVERVRAGDLQGAFNAGMAAVKAMWTELVATFADEWAPLLIMLERGWNDTTTLLSDAWNGFVGLFDGAVGFLGKAWQSFLEFIGAADAAEDVGITWNDVVFGLATVFTNIGAMISGVWESIKFTALDAADAVRSSWQKAVSFIAKKIVSIPGVAQLLGADVEDLKEELDAIGDTKQAGIKERRAEREADHKLALDRIRKEQAEAIKTLDEERERRNAEDQQKVQDAIARADSKRDAARREFNEELQRTPEARKQADAREAEQQEVANLEKSIDATLATIDGANAALARLGNGNGRDAQTGLTGDQLRDLLTDANKRLAGDREKLGEAKGKQLDGEIARAKAELDRLTAAEQRVAQTALQTGQNVNEVRDAQTGLTGQEIAAGKSAAFDRQLQAQFAAIEASQKAVKESTGFDATGMFSADSLAASLGLSKRDMNQLREAPRISASVLERETQATTTFSGLVAGQIGGRGSLHPIEEKLDQVVKAVNGVKQEIGDNPGGVQIG